MGVSLLFLTQLQIKKIVDFNLIIFIIYSSKFAIYVNFDTGTLKPLKRLHSVYTTEKIRISICSKANIISLRGIICLLFFFLLIRNRFYKCFFNKNVVNSTTRLFVNVI